MSDQFRLADSGELELDSQPLTWDGEPLLSAETVREGLFDAAAFARFRGRLSTPEDETDA